MRMISVCAVCGGRDFEFISGTHYERCYCNDCERETPVRDKMILSPYERTRNAVYATGNRWAIENWNLTHN